MKKYESYKPANLPWLDEVPSHWQMMRNKVFLTESKETVGDAASKYKLLSLTLNGIIPRDITSGKGKFPSDYSTYKIIRSGDIVFCLFDIDETPRTVGLSAIEGMLTGAYSIFHIANINPRFLYYYYTSLDNVKALKPLYTGLRKTISTDTFLDTKMPVPPRSEQEQIVRYLDWQVSKINKLIAAKKKQIALLKEQKQLFIYKAVTKGLDNTVPMKDSGVKWIGYVPSWWQVSRIKFFCTMKSGDNLTAQQIDDENEYPVYGGNGIRGYYSNYNCDGKYILIGRQGALAGNIHLVEGKFWATDHAVVTSVSNCINISYFYYLLVAMDLNQYAFDTAAQPGLAVTKIKNLGVAIPDATVQQQIVDYLDIKCKRTDKLIEYINNEITLLHELRTRLISDVVTGQIDVRSIEIPEYEYVEEESDEESDDEIDGNPYSEEVSDELEME